MGEAGEDELVDVGLDLGPWFAFLWGSVGEKGFEVAGGDVGEDGALGDGVVVLDDWGWG